MEEDSLFCPEEGSGETSVHQHHHTASRVASCFLSGSTKMQVGAEVCISVYHFRDCSITARQRYVSREDCFGSR